MKTNLYCVEDLVSGEFLPVFEARNDKTAVRDVRKALSSGNQEIKDFRIVGLGSVIRNDENRSFDIIVLPKYYLDLFAHEEIL